MESGDWKVEEEEAAVGLEKVLDWLDSFDGYLYSPSLLDIISIFYTEPSASTPSSSLTPSTQSPYLPPPPVPQPPINPPTMPSCMYRQPSLSRQRIARSSFSFSRALLKACFSLPAFSFYCLLALSMHGGIVCLGYCMFLFDFSIIDCYYNFGVGEGNLICRLIWLFLFVWPLPLQSVIAMSRSQSVHAGATSRSLTPKPAIKQENANPPPLPKPKKARPSSLSIDGSVKSHQAMEGSLKGSIVSVNSGFSGLQGQSSKSILSSYPQVPKKQQLPPSTSPQKPPKKPTPPQQTPSPTPKSSIPQPQTLYSSTFKRNFVKGLLALSTHKALPLPQVLRQLSPTLNISPQELSLWVSAYLLVFRIEHRLRRVKFDLQSVESLVEDQLVGFMKGDMGMGRGIGRARLLRLLVYVWRELPVEKMGVVEWFGEFVCRNRERLKGVDLSKYVDVSTLNPKPIDCVNLNKGATIKAKQADKTKEKQTRKQKEKPPKVPAIDVEAFRPEEKAQPKEKVKKQHIEKEKPQEAEPQPSLEKMIARRIEGQLPKAKSKGVKPVAARSVQPVKVVTEEKPPQSQKVISKMEAEADQPAPKQSLKDKIKKLAKNRHEQLNSQHLPPPPQPEEYPPHSYHQYPYNQYQQHAYQYQTQYQYNHNDGGYLPAGYGESQGEVDQFGVGVGEYYGGQVGQYYGEGGEEKGEFGDDYM